MYGMGQDMYAVGETRSPAELLVLWWVRAYGAAHLCHAVRRNFEGYTSEIRGVLRNLRLDGIMLSEPQARAMLKNRGQAYCARRLGGSASRVTHVSPALRMGHAGWRPGRRQLGGLGQAATPMSPIAALGVVAAGVFGLAVLGGLMAEKHQSTSLANNRGRRRARKNRRRRKR